MTTQVKNEQKKLNAAISGRLAHDSRALEEDAACSIFLKKTNIKTLEVISLEKLKKHAIDVS